MLMDKWVKKPIQVEVFHFTRENLKEATSLVRIYSDKVKLVSQYGGDKLYMEIDTLEGTMTANEGDYIIKGVQGELYPCKPDIFLATYDKVSPIKEKRMRFNI